MVPFYFFYSTEEKVLVDKGLSDDFSVFSNFMLVGFILSGISYSLLSYLRLKQREKVVEEKYGNLFEMYEKITDENPYETPMKIYPAVHYTMGGVWVDYNLMTSIQGCFAIGEANFSDHGANRLGASALMQGLADGYFVIPYTIGSYLSKEISTKSIDTNHEAFSEAEKQYKKN